MLTQAVAVGERYLDAATAAFGPDDEDSLEAAAELAHSLEVHARDFEERTPFYLRALELCRQAEDGYERAGQPNSVNRGNAFHTEGLILHNPRFIGLDYAASSRAFRRSIEISETNGKELSRLISEDCLTLSLGLDKHEAEALIVVDRMIAATSARPETRERWLSAMQRRGVILERLGRAAPATAQYRALLAEAESGDDTQWVSMMRDTLRIASPGTRVSPDALVAD